MQIPWLVSEVTRCAKLGCLVCEDLVLQPPALEELSPAWHRAAQAWTQHPRVPEAPVPTGTGPTGHLPPAASRSEPHCGCRPLSVGLGFFFSKALPKWFPKIHFTQSGKKNTLCCWSYSGNSPGKPSLRVGFDKRVFAGDAPPRWTSRLSVPFRPTHRLVIFFI